MVEKVEEGVVEVLVFIFIFDMELELDLDGCRAVWRECEPVL
jgi:hypothetical protein